LHHGTHIEPRIYSAGYVALTTDIPSSTENDAYFLDLLQTKVKKGKNLKTLRQNRAVLHRAALSGLKPAPDRAH